MKKFSCTCVNRVHAHGAKIKKGKFLQVFQLYYGRHEIKFCNCLMNAIVILAFRGIFVLIRTSDIHIYFYIVHLLLDSFRCYKRVLSTSEKKNIFVSYNKVFLLLFRGKVLGLIIFLHDKFSVALFTSKNSFSSAFPFTGAYVTDIINFIWKHMCLRSKWILYCVFMILDSFLLFTVSLPVGYFLCCWLSHILRSNNW